MPRNRTRLPSHKAGRSILESDRSQGHTKSHFALSDEVQPLFDELVADYCGLLNRGVATSVVMNRAASVLHRRVSRASSVDDQRREVELLIEHSSMGQKAAERRAAKAAERAVAVAAEQAKAISELFGIEKSSELRSSGLPTA